MRTLPFSICLILVGPALAAESESPRFAEKPTAVKKDGKVRIRFAVSSETDVAVYVENSKGDVVRHLVAGVLGKNPPKPLKANSPSQNVEWDGRDDAGKPAAGGPFRVRVGLRLDLKPEKVFADQRPGIIRAIAVRPGGELYVLG